MGVLVVSLLARVRLLLNIRGLSHVFVGLPIEVRPTHLASLGKFIWNPVFRAGMPKLASARCEHRHATRFGTFRYDYVAKNGNRQQGASVEENLMWAHKRNKLKCAEVSYQQLDGKDYTLRCVNIYSCRAWKEIMTALWFDVANIYDEYITQAERDRKYKDILNVLYKERMDRTDCDGNSDGWFPPNVRDLINELTLSYPSHCLVAVQGH